MLIPEWRGPYVYYLYKSQWDLFMEEGVIERRSDGKVYVTGTDMLAVLVEPIPSPSPVL